MDTFISQYERQYMIAEQHCYIDELASLFAPTYTFRIDSETIVARRDAEYADFDNPRGEVYEERYFMVATDKVGHEYRYGWEESEGTVELKKDSYPPVATWSLWRCVYGSQAYMENDCERDTMRYEMESRYFCTHHRPPLTLWGFQILWTWWGVY